jgi:hypothetical protein
MSIKNDTLLEELAQLVLVHNAILAGQSLTNLEMVEDTITTVIEQLGLDLDTALDIANEMNEIEGGS